ncbi:MAG TPA: hypothetical protein VMT34_10290 [Aggregatilineales bacterium]|nr:hypothetical protein [Aggregatilineales bacterium]
MPVSAMKAVAAFAFLLSLLLVVLCAGAVIVGHAQPESALVPGLELCDGVLCYQGIVPGETPITQARSFLAQSELNIETGGRQGGNFSYTDADSKRHLDLVEDWRHAAGFLMLGLERAPIRLGDLTNAFGPPCTIGLGGAPIVTLTYPNFEVNIFFFASRLHPQGAFSLRPDTAVSQIFFNGRQTGCTPTDFNNDDVQWHGFKTWHYSFKPPIEP